MSYLEKMLLPSEKLVCVAHLHWIIFLPGILFSVVGGFLGFFCYDIVGFAMGDEFKPVAGRILAAVGMVLTTLGFALIVGATIRQSSTELAITDGRIIAKYGFISRTTYEIMLNRITGVNFDQTVMGRILGYGTILVHGAGGDISPFDNVSKPVVFQRALIKVLGRGEK